MYPWSIGPKASIAPEKQRKIIETIASEVFDLEEDHLGLEKIHRKIAARLHKKFPEEWPPVVQIVDEVDPGEDRKVKVFCW